MISNLYLTIFAVAMAGCVLTTPLVTWLASWVGAIDRPDQFRRVHQGAIPRLGGLALALGVVLGIVVTFLHEPFRVQVMGELPSATPLVRACGRVDHPRCRVSR